MKKIIFIVIILITGINTNCQTIQELINLQKASTVDEVDKYLTTKGFKYDKAYKSQADSMPTIFFRRDAPDAESKAVVSLFRPKNSNKFDVGYNVNSINIFNEIKRQCELLPDCEFGYEETKNNGSYNRYFLDDNRTYVFSIEPEKKNSELFRYWIHIF